MGTVIENGPLGGAGRLLGCQFDGGASSSGSLMTEW